MLRFGFIGYGAIARSVSDIIANDDGFAAVCVGALVRDAHVAAPDGVVRVSMLAALLEQQPQLVLECAGQGALTQYGADVLEAGVDLCAASVGALADRGLRQRLIEAAQRGGSQLIVPAGAIGAMDALAAARASGLEAVLYRGRKPATSWRGTPAEDALDLENLTEPVTHFRGPACEAARLYPKNANVAATVAMAGLGFERTQVELIADPGVIDNIHEIDVVAGVGAFSVRLTGRPSPANPKTSMLTAFSMARALRNAAGPLVI